MNNLENNSLLLTSIKEVIHKARDKAFRNTNSVLLDMYWQIGRLIVENDQQGKSKAKYGKEVIKNLAQTLTIEFGKGFDESNLRNIRQFYLAFPNRDAVSHELAGLITGLSAELMIKQLGCNILSIPLMETGILGFYKGTLIVNT